MRMMTFRLDDLDAEHLDVLSSVSGVSRTEYLRCLVRKEWDTYNGNPELKALAENLKQIQNQMQDLISTGALDAALKK